MKDFKGNKVYVGDNVCFLDSCDNVMKEGIIDCLDEKTQSVKIRVFDVFYWRYWDTIFKITSKDSNNTSQEFKTLRIVTKDENCYDFDNVICMLGKLQNKETIVLKNVNNDSFVGRWFLEEICGYFYI